MIPDGYTFLPPGKLAAAVTYLELDPVPAVPAPAVPKGFALERLQVPDLDRYRALFRGVGSEWLWFGRLAMTDPELAATLSDDAVEVYVLQGGSDDAGLLELDGRNPGAIELAYLGLVPGFIGLGLGRFLLQTAIARASALTVRRLWVHTCTFDHPDALRVYQGAGFRPYRRAIEVFDDPRLTGILPRDCARNVPLIGS